MVAHAQEPGSGGGFESFAVDRERLFEKVIGTLVTAQSPQEAPLGKDLDLQRPGAPYSFVFRPYTPAYRGGGSDPLDLDEDPGQDLPSRLSAGYVLSCGDGNRVCVVKSQAVARGEHLGSDRLWIYSEERYSMNPRGDASYFVLIVPDEHAQFISCADDPFGSRVREHLFDSRDSKESSRWQTLAKGWYESLVSNEQRRLEHVDQRAEAAVAVLFRDYPKEMSERGMLAEPVSENERGWKKRTFTLTVPVGDEYPDSFIVLKAMKRWREFAGKELDAGFEADTSGEKVMDPRLKHFYREASEKARRASNPRDTFEWLASRWEKRISQGT